LVDPRTGAAIVGFPATPEELDSMKEHELDAVLHQLNPGYGAGSGVAVGDENLLMKKKQLRMEIGLRAERSGPKSGYVSGCSPA
jgi:hypothetical protein